MPLSEYEQRVLEQMERQLTSDDPRLANTLQQRGRRGVGRWLLVGVGFIGGLLLLVAGAAMSQLWLGVIGFLLMFGAVAFAFASPSASGPAGVVRNDGSVAPRQRRGQKPASSHRSFMSRLEERWDRRRHEGR
jgi:predicted lipid-binding transport protein (Tim44 family)